MEINNHYPYGALIKNDSSNRRVVFDREVEIPDYLNKNYWWAYLHPYGVWFFDRTFIVNSILLGNYIKLRDKALSHICGDNEKILQIAAVYGDISTRMANKLKKNSSLDIVDVAPIQLQNVGRKLNGNRLVKLHHQDATDLNFENHTYDTVMVFFLFHELPEEEKYKVASEAFRVLKPGGKLIVADYHKPRRMSLVRYTMPLLLKWLEPFALAMWRQDILEFFSKSERSLKLTSEDYAGKGLYQIKTYVKADS